MGITLILFLAIQSGLSGFSFEASAQSVDIKETLKEVFHIPTDDNPESNGLRGNGKHLNYMRRLYKKVTSGQLTLPKDSNTIRTITAKTDVVGLSDENASLLYDLSTKHKEKVVMAALHLTGHRELHRPRRLLLSLVEQGQKDPTAIDPPLMTVFVKKFPKEVDLTSLVSKAISETPQKLLKIQMEQLRSNQWVSFPTRRLHHNPPFLVLFSGDFSLFDLTAASLNQDSLDMIQYPSNKDSETFANSSIESLSRVRRFAAVNDNSIHTNEIPFEMAEISSPDNTLKLKTNFWNLDESDSNENVEFFSYNNEINNEIPLNFGPKGDDKKAESKDRINSDGLQSQESKIATPSKSSPDKRPLDEISVLSTEVEEEDGKSSLLTDTSQEGRSSKKRKTHRRKNKSNRFLPSPEFYANKKDKKTLNTKTNKKKKSRNRRKFKKSKRRRAKGIPQHWFHISSSSLKSEQMLANSAVEAASGGPCTRKEYYVDFRDLGWQKFVIQPPGFSTFYCEGSCPSPLTHSQAGTNHALVHSLLRVMTKNSPLPGPCCVPGKLDSLTFLMVDEQDRLTLHTIPNMVVKSCTCQ